ncbi:linoleoyl-CoA desaturase [Catalinimonas alkaloidigena]|uniref:Linoleoyl-CoA desaturase n=1 Tax=Catalinimonas alkaloidigena TaxID=1075417 RepID=A0A1G9AMV9_9BACT|nr:acyl-CoA desaturase [Catalinimonas alkaloidigena]SDK28662.1 linoleoyl-CoA desaturase [Catalinimonas alkaloidigena]
MNSKVRFVSSQKTEFFPILRKRVDQYFRDHNLSQKGNEKVILKTIVMFALYFVPYFMIISGAFPLGVMWLLALVMGLGIAGIGLAVMHDANHGTLSDHAWINRFFGYSLNVIGGNAFTWKVQHNVLHHTYTNIHEMDEDLDAGIIVRLSPHAPHYYLHRYQHIYAFMLYGLVTLSWVLFKDFIKITRYNKMGLTAKQRANASVEVGVIILTKLLYVAYMVVLPLVLLDITWWQFLIGFMTMHLTAGLILSLVFQTAHVVEETLHPQVNAEGCIENQWAIHQLVTTANFSRKNRLLSWYVGGLNYQVEHHLFPNINHIHYRPLSEIVKATAAEFDLPYHDQPTFLKAIRSHARLLKELGKPVPAVASVRPKAEAVMAD